MGLSVLFAHRFEACAESRALRLEVNYGDGCGFDLLAMWADATALCRHPRSASL